MKLHKNAIDLTNQKFGRLTALHPIDRRIRHNSSEIIWECFCTCGQTTKVLASYLRSGHTKSCGCLHKEMASQRFRKHGQCRSRDDKPSREYQAYHAARRRCKNPRSAHYMDYGGRGIKFLFTSFEEFFNHVGPKPTSRHTLDRFPNNDGHYEIGNVRWATPQEQSYNKRNKRLEHFSDKDIQQEFLRRWLNNSFSVKTIS